MITDIVFRARGMMDRETEIPPIDGTPVKRFIRSIISDCDLRTSLCELIDNAIDQWSDRGHSGLTVDLVLDVERQLITVRDNAGGGKLRQSATANSAGAKSK